MAMIMESPSVEELCTALGESEKALNQLTENFRDWLKLQPHLPQNLPKEILEYFIIGTKMSLEQAKHKLDMFFTMKRLVPELYANRDPRDSRFTRLHSMMQIVYLPKLTPEKYRVCFIRPMADDYSKYDPYESVKYTLMIEEMLMAESRSLGLVYVFDQSKVSLGLIAKYTPTVLKKSEITLSEAYAKRIKGIHLINASPITGTLIGLTKKVLKPKLAARVQAYVKGDYESLYQHIPKSILPKEYGGDEPPMAHLDDVWRRRVAEKRDWFLEQEKIVADERLRPGPGVDGEDLFGFSGSFRKLDVD